MKKEEEEEERLKKEEERKLIEEEERRKEERKHKGYRANIIKDEQKKENKKDEIIIKENLEENALEVKREIKKFIENEKREDLNKNNYIQDVIDKDAPLPKQKELLKKLENNLLLCPKCSSEIEIILLNEETNMFEFKCIKNSHKIILSITQYIKELETIKNENNLNIFKDQCSIHKNNNYIIYCFDCNCHLCNECLKTGKHLIHKKSNIIEIQPLDIELKIISEVIKDKKIKLEKLYKEKEIKTKELNDELSDKKKKEIERLNNKIEDFEYKSGIELEQNKKKYIKEIKDIKEKYETEIKKLKIKYKTINNKIINIYKLKNTKEQIKHNLIIKKLTTLYKNKYDSYKFESKIEKAEGLIKINENIYNLYNAFNNNYFNAVNINNILMSYSKNKYNNNKMRQILGNDYNSITNMVTNKYKEGINILEKKDELEELKIKFEKEKIKSEKLSDMNIELSRTNEKNEEEINNLKEKNNELDKIKKDKEHKEKILYKYNKYFGEEMKELEKYEIQNTNVNFEIAPNILEYGGKLSSDRINSGLLYNIGAYVGLEDKMGYLIYQNLDFDLIVKRIYDQKIIKTLKGHKNKIRVIRYYHNKNNKIINEEYILS